MITFPRESTATHRLIDGHDADAPPPGSLFRLAGADHAAKPTVGSVELTTRPELSSATHSEAEAQETSTSGPLPSMFTSRQAAAPPLGLVDITALPTSSTATHSETETQLTPDSA